MNKRCKHKNKQTSEWASTYVLILDCSEPWCSSQYNNSTDHYDLSFDNKAGFVFLTPQKRWHVSFSVCVCVVFIVFVIVLVVIIVFSFVSVYFSVTFFVSLSDIVIVIIVVFSFVAVSVYFSVSVLVFVFVPASIFVFVFISSFDPHWFIAAHSIFFIVEASFPSAPSSQWDDTVWNRRVYILDENDFSHELGRKWWIK